MAGRLGNEQVTVQNLKVVKFDVSNSLLLVKGAVPGQKKTDIQLSRNQLRNTNRKEEDKTMPVLNIYNLDGSQSGTVSK